MFQRSNKKKLTDLISNSNELAPNSHSHSNLKVERVRGVDTHLSRMED